MSTNKKEVIKKREIVAFAETSDAPMEPAQLSLDFTALKESGVCLCGAIPGAAYEEILAAGLHLNGEPDAVKPNEEAGITSRIYSQQPDQTVCLDDIRFHRVEFQFTEDSLVNMDIYLNAPNDLIPLENVVSRLTSYLGEPTEENMAPSNTRMSVEWRIYLENGRIIEVTASGGMERNTGTEELLPDKTQMGSADSAA